MREDVRERLAIDASSTLEDRTIDITTTGRRSGRPRRIEIVFYRLCDDIYLSGIPGPKLATGSSTLAARPQFTFHLKHRIMADLPATASVIVDPAERRRVLAVFVEEFNRRHGPGHPVAGGHPRRMGGTQPVSQGHLRGDRLSAASRLGGGCRGAGRLRPRYRL